MADGSIRVTTVREHMALRLAGATYMHAGARDHAIVTRLGYTPPRFWQVVNALIDRADVEAEYPQVVRRLRRLRDRRAGVRSGGAVPVYPVHTATPRNP